MYCTTGVYGLPYLYAFDEVNGTLKWSKPGWRGPFAIAYGNIYISINNEVHALDALTGLPVPGWKVYTAVGYEDPLYYTVVANKVVYAVFEFKALEKSIIVALDAYTGDKLWELTADSILKPVIAHGSLYISSMMGMVYRYSYNPDIYPTRFVSAIAVWSHDSGSTNLTDIYYSIYDATNDTWWTLAGTPAAPIASLTGNDNFPAIAFDHSHNAIAIWSHDTGGTTGYDLYYSEWRGSAVGWTTPLPVASLKGDDIDPAVALWKDGTGMAVWCHDSEMWYATWTGAWGTPAKLVDPWPSGLTVYYKQPEITYDANHNAIAVWTDESYWYVYYSVFNGTGWTSPTPISKQPDGAAVESRKGIASDRLGNAKVVWNSEGYGFWDNQYALWNGSAFSPSSTIYSGSAGLGTAIAFDASNNAIAIHGTTLAFGNIWCNREMGGVWQPTQLVSTNGREPRIAFLPNGKAVAVWCGPGPNDPDIIYSILDPNSGTWTTSPIVPTGLPGTDAPWEGSVSIASSSGSPTMPPLTFGVAPPVGGILIPIDKFCLLAPYIGLASTTIIAAAATTIYIKRIKHKKQKQ
ncbi:MAG: hypothetical protein QW270_02410 [Candidatus Bathyarchaeia archaeon]